MSSQPVPAPDGHGDSSGWREFLGAWVRNPVRVGAVWPSSRRLSEKLARVAPGHGTPVVVELGPGTGAVTAEVARRLSPEGRHLAVELDPGMARYLQRRHPDVEVVNGDARKLGELLAERGIEQVDAVVSGLPWSLFDQAGQQEILGQVVDVIGEHGAFTTFAYSHTLPMRSARRFRATLQDTFDEVVTTRTVWRNVPPAFCFICRRPSR
ncbi:MULTISPECIES: class I SAM-dependent methyltransferase [Pseudonocardia]|uniref:16S ribosomal RNA methyltransferase KsgA/Dim1 family protein n=2 Tax=Pseudonocardia TaxID=1847 RepID=A0A1Y2N1H3_PSEAH|nr:MULTISPECIES: methyltransferase domain-containing protein [Pseudonocardia]OSY41290.1 16S ribosomal RNA methyltransferase KsgA/Dim1 family protein [Pseudonocardia autotrophica]TDN76746.1 phospholipid N-methyltransferase [Pseudonocardia autotrophica]BBG00747.1 methyltransferase [Pseudonocardia autotrophica]GEC24287.1 methyltransferase [Pseudonocardia saturnea]